jgi:fimbrial chaperone protein
VRCHSLTASVLASAAALWLPPASAGTFTISPLKVELSAQSTTAALTVRNEDEAAVVVQAETLLWKQAAGEDVLEPTRDVLVSPAVFTLPGKGSQLVRVALRRAADPARELSYRLILQEVPQQAKPGFTGLQVALRLSLPVFVASTAPSQAELAWSATRDPDGQLVLRAENTGEAHAKVLGLTLTPLDGAGPALQQSVVHYVLPAEHRTWTIAISKKTRDDGTATADGYRLKANTERGEVIAELSVGK